MDSRFSAALRLLPEYLTQHVLLSASALALGLLVSVPLILAASRSAAWRWPVLAVASLVQTIPSLALLALFYPLLLGLSSLSERFFGHSFSALGFLPSLLALTLYSMLPMLRNGTAAFLNLDPAVLEAARAVGMRPYQQLLRVELPLAAPVLMAGVRTAAVWVIGAATLSTPVGQTSLGNFIFSGLQIENWVSVLFGCAAAVALALATDQLLGLAEHGVARRRAAPVLSAAGLLAAGVLASLVWGPSNAQPTYLIGAKNFTEQYVLSALLQERLRDQGATAARRTGLGSAIVYRALANNEIDAYVDYSGTLWANVLRRTDQPGREMILRTLRDRLVERDGVTLLGPLGFENAYALAMRRSQAQSLQIRTIADLARHAPALSIGGDFEFFARPEWRTLRDRYGLRFREQRQYQSTFMYRAIASDDVQVISAFSSDGRIAANDLLVLDDPLAAVLPYDAVLLLSPMRASDPVLLRALTPLIEAVPIELMRRASLMVDGPRAKVAPREAAVWLASQISTTSKASAAHQH